MTDETQNQTPEPEQPEESAVSQRGMHIDPYERKWMRFSVVTLVVFFASITVAGFALGIQVPTDEGRVDPNTLDVTPPWSDPGLREIVPGKEFDLFIVATRFSFNPRTVTVPQGAKVNFYATSNDVLHSLTVLGTNVNLKVIPGQVSHLSAVFDEVGTHNYICTEFCGLGHSIMYGTLTVVTPEEFEALRESE